MASTRPIAPRSGRRLAAWAVILVVIAAACAPESVDDQGIARGLLTLTAGAEGQARLDLVTDRGGTVGPENVVLPGPETTWIDAGRADVLVATLADGGLAISDPVASAADDLDWREVQASDPSGPLGDGPFWFPTWDPEGGRFATVRGNLVGGAGLDLLLVDPTLGTSFAIPLDATVLAAPPAWLEDDRLTLVGGTSAAPTALIVDATDGSIGDGPGGARRLATSADGSRIATSAGPGQPVVVRLSEAWLAVDGTSIGSVEAPSADAVAASFALDRDGGRLAIAWRLDDGTVRVDVHDETGGWRRVASRTLDDGARGAVVGWLRSSP